MPRTPRNPGSGKPPHNGPARNQPATGSWGTSVNPPAWTADHQPSGEAKSAGKAVAAEIREKIAARKDEILTAQFNRAIDNAHPNGHAAAVDLLNRIMPPKSETDLTSGGEPLEIVRRIIVTTPD